MSPRRSSSLKVSQDSWETLPRHHDDLRQQLQPGELLLAWFEPDLDHRLHYVTGLVVLTDRRVLTPDPTPTNGAPARFLSWPLGPDVTLKSEERAGVGSLELQSPT